MAEQSIYKLKIDENLKRLILPLSSIELQQLEQNLIRDGCREPLCVWNNTILDGHNRHEICTRLQISFSIQRIYFQSREEAIAWICASQLGRRNITNETRMYLIGKRYEMMKIIGAHKTVRTNKHNKKDVRPKILTEPAFDKTACRTSERLGEEYHISYTTVNRYGVYAHALDTLSKVVPELFTKVLSGKVKMTQEQIIELSRLSPQDVLHLGKHISDDTFDFVGYTGTHTAFPKRQNSPGKLTTPIPAGCVKNMPTYDPDSEISSLALTIPSWVSSINRTRSVANLSEISNNARSKLEKELVGLKETINTMLETIKEII